MNAHLEEYLVRERLNEARALASHQALLRRLRPARQALRVAVGLALIRAGRWVAGRAPRRAVPERRTAMA